MVLLLEVRFLLAGKECNFWMKAHSLGGFADGSSIDDLLAVTGITLLC